MKVIIYSTRQKCPHAWIFLFCLRGIYDTNTNKTYTIRKRTQNTKKKPVILINRCSLKISKKRLIGCPRTGTLFLLQIWIETIITNVFCVKTMFQQYFGREIFGFKDIITTAKQLYKFIQFIQAYKKKIDFLICMTILVEKHTMDISKKEKFLMWFFFKLRGRYCKSFYELIKRGHFKGELSL